MASSFNFSDIQTVPVTISFTDGAGNPAPVTGVAVSSDNAAVFTAAVDAAILGSTAPDAPITSATATLTAAGALGSANLQVTATAADGTTISGSAPFSVIASPAKIVTIVPGSPSAIVVPPVAPAPVDPAAPATV